MKTWIDLVFSFVCGLAAGIACAFIHFKSRLDLYKEFVEHRLLSINKLRPAKNTPGYVRKLAFWNFNETRRQSSDEKAKGPRK